MGNAALDQSPSAFGALLKDYRVRADLTQEELAEGSGVSVRAISDMERGIARSPQRRTIEALAVSLSLSGDELTQLQRISKQSRSKSAPAEPVPAEPPESPARIFEPAAITLLPPDLHDLTGRAADLAALRSFAEQDLGGRRSTRVAVVSGPPGAGKTSLAVRAAYDIAEHFPDGQLFLKLHGMSADPADPTDVLHLALRSLGVDTRQIPAELELRASLCRSLLSERAMLVVLDDAANEAQVRPLLAGGPRCLTVITSRHLLPGVEAAARFSLGTLERDDAVALLGSIIGAARVEQEPAAAVDLVELCGRLPLAIRVAGNRLASRPKWPLEHHVAQIRRGGSLTALTAGDLDVRSVFDLSYRQLTPAAATLFRRLSLVLGADFSVGAAAVLADAGNEDDADIHLDELFDASLVQPSQQDGRYQFHDLLRVFAKEVLAQEEAAEAVARSEERLDDWLLSTATKAGGYFQPSGDMTTPPSPSPWFADHVRARQWLEAELGNWRAALRRTAARQHHQQVIDLAESMHWYSEFGGTADLWHEVFSLAVEAAVAIGDKRDEAVQRNYLAWTLNTLLGRSGESADMAALAMDAAVAAGDPREQAWARIYLGNAQTQSGNPAEAIATFSETLRLFDQAGYALGHHVARAMRASHLAAQGDFDHAAEEFAACVEYFRAAADAQRTAVDEASLAYLLLRSAQNLIALGDLTTALRQCEQALGLFGSLGAALGDSRARHISSVVLQARGEHEAAREGLSDALAQYERTGQPRQLKVEALSQLAVSAEALGDPAAARAARERALALIAEMPASVPITKLREELSTQLGQ